MNELDWELTDEQRMLRNTARRIAREKVAPRAEEIDRTGEFPWDIRNIFIETGFLGMMIPEEYGGMGAGVLDCCLVTEEIGQYDTACCALILNQGLAIYPVIMAGTEAQKRKWLPGFASGEYIGAFGMTEPGAGSDAGMMRTTAILNGDHYTVNGSKCFCSQANLADVISLLAKTDPAAGNKGISCLLLEKGTPGYEVSMIEDKIAAKGSPTNQVFIEDCHIPKENLVGKEGQGLSLGMKALDRGRILIGAMSVGLAQGALNMAVEYGKTRETFGKPIVQHQAIQFKIADMVTEIEAARLLVYKAAGAIDHNCPQYARFGAMAKCFATDVLMRVSIEAVQIFGGYGLCKEYQIEKYMREAKVNQIVEGTNEMQRIVIANEFFKGR